jgi:hypothetical protein
MSRHAAERCFAAESHAIGNSEFRQQGRNVKLHRAFRNVEFRGNFLVREALNNAIQHFLLTTAYLNSRSQGAPCGQKLLSTLCSRVQERFSRNNQ